MTGAEFQKLLDANPFEPFIVNLAGGSSQEIQRPEWVTVTPGDCAHIKRPDGYWAMIALRHVIGIVYVDIPVIR